MGEDVECELGKPRTVHGPHVYGKAGRSYFCHAFCQRRSETDSNNWLRTGLKRNGKDTKGR